MNRRRRAYVACKASGHTTRPRGSPLPRRQHRSRVANQAGCVRQPNARLQDLFRKNLGQGSLTAVVNRRVQSTQRCPHHPTAAACLTEVPHHASRRTCPLTSCALNCHLVRCVMYTSSVRPSRSNGQPYRTSCSIVRLLDALSIANCSSFAYLRASGAFTVHGVHGM